MATPRDLYNQQEETWKEIFQSSRELESFNHFLTQGATNAEVDIFGTDWNSNDAIKEKLELMYNATFDRLVHSISESDNKHKNLKDWLKSDSMAIEFTFDKEQTHEIDATKPGKASAYLLATQSPHLNQRCDCVALTSGMF